MTGRAVVILCTAALALAVLFSVLRPLFGLFDPAEIAQNGSRIAAALVGTLGALITALSGVLLFGAQARQREREREQERQGELDLLHSDRLEEIRKLVTALRAEVSVSLDRYIESFGGTAVPEALAVHRQTIEAAQEEGTSKGMPVGIALEADMIFESCRDRIMELPSGLLLRALVRYYQNDAYMTQYLNQMSTGRFDGLSVERQKRATVHYYMLGQETLASAVLALFFLDDYLFEGGKSAASLADLRRPMKADATEAALEQRIDMWGLYKDVRPATNGSRMTKYLAIMGLGGQA